MAILKPLRAWRPPRDLAQRLACLPYDVVNRAEAAAIAAGNEHCFFHVTRPEIDFPNRVDEHSDQVYHRGRTNLDRFRAKGWLRKDSEPAFYVYGQQMGTHSQVGLVGLASVHEYNLGRVRKHELTRPDKEDDRTKHIRSLDANDESVFLTYRANPTINALVTKSSAGEPAFDFVADDGVRHTLWIVPAAQTRELEAALQTVELLYVADGHHRCAAAARAHALYEQEGRAGGHGYFLATVFPHDQVQILAYNRVVRDLDGLGPEGFVEALGRDFTISPSEHPEPRKPREFGLYVAGRWHRLEARAGRHFQRPLDALDVSILHRNILEKILRITDVRSDLRVQFVGGIRGSQELERLVDGGEYQAAFALYPTQLEQLMAVADDNGIMPPKSTWFEPKLRSGLLVYSFFD